MLRSALGAVSASSLQVSAAHAAEAIVSPSLSPLIDAALAGASADIGAIGGQIEALASLCDDRAVVCAEHEADLERWHHRMAVWRGDWFRWQNAGPDEYAPWPGPQPPRPTAPYSWVDPK